MARGIDGRDLFLDNQDRNVFLDLLAGNLMKAECVLYAWALMSNHYHLVLQSGTLPLSALMRPLNSNFARYYARRYRRRGYLFQDRFKSLATRDQSYVKEMIRYVHANPIRAGVCQTLRELDKYPWTGHSALMGWKKRSFQDTNSVLRRFARKVVDAKRRYRDFLAETLSDQSANVVETIRKNNIGIQSVHQTGCWVIGDAQFVRSVMKDTRNRRLRLARYRKEGITLEQIATRIASRAGLPREKLNRRSRGTFESNLRKVFAYICRYEYEFPVVEIGRFLGIQGPATSTSIAKGQILASQKRFANLFINLRPGL